MSRRRLIGALAFLFAVVGSGALAPTLSPSLKAAMVQPPESPQLRLTPAALASSTRAVPAEFARAVDRESPTPRQMRMRERRRLEASIKWRRSTPIGTAAAGSLSRGVKLPHEGVHFFTLDPVRWSYPNRPDRRYGSDRLIRTVLRVAREHRAANPGAPRITVGDLSRPRGGSFSARYGVVGEFGPGRGTLGHVSHQNGLDVDIYYPRADRRERGPRSVADVDLVLAQDLVDRFVAAGAEFVFVGPNTPLTGPASVVRALPRHDDHLHVRLPAG